ncbi:MAG TPA: OmpA family protein [Stellaceae bacterium]|nr:OmpA family protein [Stellaceae bacterium]
MLSLGLAACSPIAAYRNMVGISKDDPNPATTPNTKNLAAGEAESYPNLATVPAPPTQALSTAQLDRLTQSLIADRRNARYTTERLQAGFDTNAGAVPPPPPPPPPIAAKPAPSGSAGPAVATTAATSPSAGSVALATTAGPKTRPNAAVGANGLRKSGQPPEPGPMESSLQSPQIPELPNPQQSEPPPPPPRELAMPVPPATPGKAAGPAHLPPPPAAAPLPAAIASTRFEPPPPPPVLPPTTAPGGMPAGAAAAQAKGMPVAEVDFAAGSTSLDPAGRQELAGIVPLYRRHPGKVRIVGYSGVNGGATQQLDEFQTALDRAHAVAAALTKAGIPADKILVEAAPAGTDSGQGRAEILFER